MNIVINEPVYNRSMEVGSLLLTDRSLDRQG